MLPPIAVVDSVEMIRDGGSFAAIFHGSDSCEYWLFFKILTRELNDQTIERLGYATPKIVNRHTNIEVPITWAHASTLLNQIGTMIHQSEDLKWHGMMQNIAISNGPLPDEIEKVLRSFRLSAKA